MNMYRKLQLGLSGLVVSCIWFNVCYQSKNISENNKTISENTKEMEKYIDIVL